VKEKYIRKVKKLLPLKLRKEVLRDLEEIFRSAAEHGESEEEVAGRLGCPCDFAKEAALQLGVDLEKRKTRRLTAWAVISGTVAVLFGGLWLRIRALRNEAFSVGIIGGADGPTSIIVSGPDFDPAGLSLVIAIAAAFIALLILVKFLRKKK